MTSVKSTSGLNEAGALDAAGRHEAALERLSQAAAEGDAKAAVRLGARLLTGDRAPMDPHGGIRALMRADELGAVEAPERLAVLLGMGAGLPQSWGQALGLVAEGAKRGSDRARRQLCLLAAGPAADSAARDAGDWRALAQMVDIAAWTTPPPKQPLSETPRIRALPGFASPAVCDWLIGAGAGRAAPAQVYDAQSGAGRIEEARSNSAFELGLLDLDLVTVLLRARIAAATGAPVGALEPPQILHYAVGQKFDRHYDFLDVAEPGYAKDVAERGQRIITFLIYLNAGFEGGATEFPRAGVSFKGAPGDAVMFANVDRAGKPDPLTLHAGNPPTSGEKWLFSQWIRDRTPPPVG